MKVTSIGKYRGLQQCATIHGGISVLALDHRNNLRQSLNPSDPNSVKDTELTEFKIQVIKALAPNATAVLLDPQFGAAQCIAAGALPGQIGLLTAVEESGYTGDPTARNSGILPGWSVAKSRRMGATAIKLLVYYHPQASTARAIEDLVKQVVQDCKENDIPLFLETLSYSLDSAKGKLSPDERRKVVIETAARLTPLGPDILKAEFPLDIQAVTDEHAWAAACAELSAASVIPWVLLSASVGYETFLRQVTVACQSGASGVAVGRAVWKEATALKSTERSDFLVKTATPRMARVTALCDALARPWTEFYSTPAISSSWYPAY
jgi:tagatose 1,6-diphosphate aldolase